MEDKCPGFIWISYDIAQPSKLMINSEETYYENPFNCEIPQEDCFVEIRCGTAQFEPLLSLLPNDQYQYHLVIEQLEFQNILQTMLSSGKNMLNFHCSQILDEVILFCEKPMTILTNYNSQIECENFVSTFDATLLSQLPFGVIQSTVLYLFISPNLPLKVSFPLDESDDNIDFNINIVPHVIHNVDSDDNDFLNMCLSMSRTHL
jgi:hypothetical protein